MKLLVGGAYAKFDDMLWTLPGKRLADIVWKIHYGQPTKEELSLLAGSQECYLSLIQMPERRRRQIISRLREALKLDAESENDGR